MSDSPWKFPHIPDHRDQEIALLKTQLAQAEARAKAAESNYLVAVQGLRNLAYSIKVLAADLLNLSKKGDPNNG